MTMTEYLTISNLRNEGFIEEDTGLHVEDTVAGADLEAILAYSYLSTLFHWDLQTIGLYHPYASCCLS